MPTRKCFGTNKTTFKSIFLGVSISIRMLESTAKRYRMGGPPPYGQCLQLRCFFVGEASVFTPSSVQCNVHVLFSRLNRIESGETGENRGFGCVCSKLSGIFGKNTVTNAEGSWFLLKGFYLNIHAYVNFVAMHRKKHSINRIVKINHKKKIFYLYLKITIGLSN